MYIIIIIKRNCFTKRKNIVGIMSQNIDEGRRICRQKRNFDSMMSYLLENTSSDKKKITENLIIDSCGKTANNNSNFIDHDDPNNEIVDIDIDVSDDYDDNPDYTYFEENTICESTTTPVFNKLILHFNINKIVLFYGEKISRGNRLMQDDKIPLINGTENVTSKGIFARRLLQWFEENEITKKGQLNLLKLMHNAFGRTINLPVKTTMKHLPAQNGDEISVGSEDIFNKSAVLSTIDDYDGSITRFLAFHQCVNDCTVFVGNNHRSFECPICQSPRFRACVRINCENKGKSICEHLLQNDGVPNKQLYYRPIRLLIMDLVRTEWFVKALNYKRKDFRQYYKEDNSISENGIIADTNLQEMKDRFEAWKKEDSKRLDYEMVNILLSEFYDGVQLFKRRTKDFNCLITGILNLPPTYRGKEGISNFITAVYEGKHKFAEQVLFSDLYVEELQSLLQGFEFSCNGKQFFIQARLILHIMDTKAAEGVFKFQNCGNSTQGCPSCHVISGIHDGAKCIYLGHRYTLPLHHFLRPIGQSHKCCPAEFYSDNKWFSMELFPAGREKVSSIHDVYKSNKQRQDPEYCLPCDGDTDRKQNLMEIYSPNASESQLLWFHTGDFSLEKIRNEKTGLKRILYFRHYDLRNYQQYNRYSYTRYVADAQKAEELNATNEKSSKRKTAKPIGVRGVKGLWPFARYPIADISTQSGPPGIHAITGCVRMLLDIIMGEYTLKDPKSKKGIPLKDAQETGLDLSSDNVDVAASDDEYGVDDESSTDSHKEEVPAPAKNLYIPEYRPKTAPYSANKHDTEQITYWLRCVLLPKGMADDSWDIKLSSIGSLKMNQKLKVISCYWDLIMLGCPSIDASFRLFYRMFAADIMQMQRLKFTLEDVDRLQNCILESISSWEGALPAKTLHYKVHQLVDIPSSLRNFGTLLNSSEFSGERMVGIVKDHKLHSNSGGGSFGNIVMRKQVRREGRKMNEFYSKSINTTNSDAPNGKHLQLVNGELIFNDFPFKLHKDKSEITSLRHYEIEHLVDLLICEVSKRFSANEETCKTESVLYKLIKTHRKKQKSNIDVLIDAANQRKDAGIFDHYEITIAKKLLKGETVFYRGACIYGLKFCSRGSDNRQNCSPKVYNYGAERIPGNYDTRRGDGVLDWVTKASYSSWCMFHGNDSKLKFGQLNGFFEINIGDPGIDGLLVASVTSRIHEKVEGISFVKEIRSLDVTQIFVSLQDICPTLIGVCPFTRKKGRLIAISINVNRSNGACKNKNLICTDKKLVTEFAMIILHPERLSGQPDYRPYTAFYDTVG